jgi:hypothetical protein
MPSLDGTAATKVGSGGRDPSDRCNDYKSTQIRVDRRANAAGDLNLVQANSNVPVERRERLGGLLNFDCRRGTGRRPSARATVEQLLDLGPVADP